MEKRDKMKEEKTVQREKVDQNSEVAELKNGKMTIFVRDEDEESGSWRGRKGRSDQADDDDDDRYFSETKLPPLLTKVLWLIILDR